MFLIAGQGIAIILKQHHIPDPVLSIGEILYWAPKPLHKTFRVKPLWKTQDRRPAAQTDRAVQDIPYVAHVQHGAVKEIGGIAVWIFARQVSAVISAKINALFNVLFIPALYH